MQGINTNQSLFGVHHAYYSYGYHADNGVYLIFTVPADREVISSSLVRHLWYTKVYNERGMHSPSRNPF